MAEARAASKGRRLSVLAASVLLLTNCAPPTEEFPVSEVVPSADRLFVWTTDSDSVDLNFLTVLDAERGSPTYGEIVATLPVPTEGAIRGHHVEHRMPDGGFLFANDFGTGETYVLDLGILTPPGCRLIHGGWPAHVTPQLRAAPQRERPGHLSE